jgi:hypothetical protein
MTAPITPAARAAPKDHAAAVVKSDSTTFAQPSVLFVGGAGDVVVDTAGGETDVTIVAVAGQIIPLRVVRVKAATTATSIVRMWD